MTEERAKKVLHEQIEKYGQEYDAEGIEALEMAIKALEQESITWIVGKDNCQVAVKNMPIDKMQKICAIIRDEEQQPCEDAISREDAIGIVARIKEMHINDRERYQINYGTICDIDLALQQLPSVTSSYNSIKTELEPCEDCVSRKELLGRIDAERRHLLDVGMDGAEHIIVHHARRIIEDMPSVKPQMMEGEEC